MRLKHRKFVLYDRPEGDPPTGSGGTDKTFAEEVRTSLAGIAKTQTEIRDESKKTGESVLKLTERVTKLEEGEKTRTEEKKKTDEWIGKVEKVANRIEHTSDPQERAAVDWMARMMYGGDAGEAKRKLDNVLQVMLEIPTKYRDAGCKHLQSLVLSGCNTKLGTQKRQQHLARLEKIRTDFPEMFSREVHPLLQRIDLQIGTVAEGGHLVSTPFEATVLRLERNASILRTLATVLPMTKDKHVIPALDTNPTAFIVPEETDMSSSAEAWAAGPFSQKNWQAKKLGTYTEVSGELAQDNDVLLFALLAQWFGESLGLLVDDQGLEGDGTGNNFTGLFAAAGLNSVAVTGAITYDKLVDVIYAAPERSRRNANFVCHRRLLREVAKLKDTGGMPIFTTAFGIPGQAIADDVAEGMILGHRTYISDEIATNRGAGLNETTLYFGNFGSMHFMLGDLMGLEIATSDDFKFATFQIAVRALQRTALLVAVPSAFTKGTAIIGAAT